MLGPDDIKVEAGLSLYLDDPIRPAEQTHTPAPPAVSELLEPRSGPIAFGAPHFRCLGVNSTTIYVQPSKQSDIIDLPIGSLKYSLLFRLAPQQWWEVEYQGKHGADWPAAINALVQACKDAGRFNPETVVGAGVYKVGRGVIAHLGDELVANGKRYGLSEFASTEVIFAQGLPSRLTNLPPLGDFEAQNLVNLCQKLDWQAAGMAEQLAGWIAIAPLSGALRWRPHIWITGPFESGKSFVLNDVVGRMLHGVSVPVAGSVTEAGIRQALSGRSWPVLIDEAEGKDEKSANRIASILELMRASASQEGARVIKGGSGGKSTFWRVRSAFALASIDPTIVQSADASRIVRLALNGPRDKASEAAKLARRQRFSAIKADLLRMEQSDFSGRLFLRTLQEAPTILANTETFAVALASKTSSGRVADTLAPLLAGWRSLVSDDAALPLDEAENLIAGLPWIEAAAQRGATERDHDTCLRHLLTCQIRNDSGEQRTVGELIETVAGQSAKQEASLLGRHGLRVQKDSSEVLLLLCRGHSALKALFHGTQWASSPLDTLSQHPTASNSTNPVRFGSGIKQRAVQLSLSAAGFFS